MQHNPEQSQQDEGGIDTLRSLSQRVLGKLLNVLAVAVPSISLFIMITTARRNALNGMTTALSLYTLFFPLLRVASSRLGFRWTAFSLLGLLALTAFLIEVRGGVAVGNISINVLVLLLSALFFGRRGAAICLVTIIALFGLAGYAVSSGYVPPIDPAMWDPSKSVFWGRESLALALFGLAIVIVEVYIVERLAQEALRLKNLAEREHEQRLALERTQREREHEREQRLLAQKALEESRRIEALARLAGGIAHDFNNTLTVIMGNTSILDANPDADELKACSKDILEAARGAAELTRQLLTLGYRQVSKPQIASISTLFARLQSTFRRVLPSDIALVFEASSSDLTVYTDTPQLERALYNLMLNARDAMPNGGTLRVDCHPATAADGIAFNGAWRAIAIRISDSGVGVPAETLERIFEPFFTTKAPGLGTGLGLATVHAFAKESGGTVTVSSSAAGGTTFTLLLPRDAPPDRSTESPSAPLVASLVPRSGRLLVVDDRTDVRTSIVRILSRNGFDVSEAADGDRALSLLSQGKGFDLLCIDGVMPGTATSSVIKQAERLAPETRVLLCSGYLEQELLRRGVAAGRYAFLQKPFSADELVDTVRRLISRPPTGSLIHDQT